ncbi:ATP-binding cassette domain-containing protein [Nonomuraea ferruginea]
MLVVESLVTRYGAVEALHGVSLTVGTGEAVAIVGPNGASKTTLLRTISGLVRPASRHRRDRRPGDGAHGRAPDRPARRQPRARGTGHPVHAHRAGQPADGRLPAARRRG